METKKDSTKIISYLSFKLQDEIFAAHVSKVVNILEMTRITKVPKAPDYMIGIINLRGKVLPVVDTRKKFQMPSVEYTDKTCIIVMDLRINDEVIYVGGLVDEVVAVLEIEEHQIEPAPNIGSAYRSEFINGVARIDETFIMILDMIKIFSSDELINIAHINNEEKEAVV